MLKKIRIAIAGGFLLFGANASADLLDDLLAAADGGQCIETVVAGLISAPGGVEQAGEIVAAALQAAYLRANEQQALGCQGDIAVQAITAGADPDDVLEATAAGIGSSAPASFGGVGGINAGGGAGSASAS